MVAELPIPPILAHAGHGHGTRIVIGLGPVALLAVVVLVALWITAVALHARRHRRRSSRRHGPGA